MGLLDVLNSDQGRLGLGLLAAAGGRSDGAGFGQRMAEGLGSYDHWKKQQAQAKLQKMQEEEMQAQVEARKKAAAQAAADEAGIRPYLADPQLDPRLLLQNPNISLGGIGKAMEMNSKFNPAKKFSMAPQYDQSGRAFVMSDDGTMKYLDGVKARDKLISEDLGGKKIYRTEYSPEAMGSTDKTMTFSDRIAQAQLGLSRERLNFEKNKPVNIDGGKPMTPLQETKYRTQVAKDHQAANSVIQNMDDVIDSITSVKTAKGLDRATGLYSYVPSLPNSDAATADVRLQNLEGKITNLGKAAASASGAMGPMAVQEWKIVRDMVAAIDPKKGKKALIEQLDLAENAAKGAAQRIRDGYEKHYSADFEKYPQFADLNASKDRTPKPDAPSKPPMKGQTVDGYKYMGGDPAVKSNWVKQ